MTIYILDKDPQKIAEYLDDYSLNKMILNIAQVLCNAHFIHPLKEGICASSWIPLLQTKECKWSEWVRKCKANYLYLAELGIASLKQYNYRFDLNLHMIEQAMIDGHPLEWARDNVPDLPLHVFEKDFMGHETIMNGLLGNLHTSIPLVMPKKYRDSENIYEIFGGSIFYFPYVDRGHGYIEVCPYDAYTYYYLAKLKQSKNEDIIWTFRKQPIWVSL